MLIPVNDIRIADHDTSVCEDTEGSGSVSAKGSKILRSAVLTVDGHDSPYRN